ncbi:MULTISPECIES: SDR family NAD(P)-dependent oxidoreductase [unclassified Caballeronia]|uniref:SDR family NAD(P)-dependent oxidoreductase n=1 Tax=unclassified Caballeronia TaxID=2646786 RepID=UPI002028745D|nr:MULTISPECIES: SDR family oxidoreductase [unclassified Caballeronia]
MSNRQRTAVITGASSGIGLALAAAYLERGYNVVGNARSDERLDAASKKLGQPKNFLTVAGDIGLPDTASDIFDRAIETFGQVDILISNAGIFIAKPIGGYDTDDFDRLVNTNLKGFFYPTQRAVSHMVANGNGHIVNITAAIGIQPNVNVPAVLPVMVKGGLNQATKSLAVELAKHNVKVNAVAPGVIDTPLQKPDRHPFLATLNPLGRIGNVKEIVQAVLYLTDSDFVTGTILTVDGGATAGR